MGCATTTVKISSITLNVLLAILGFGAIIWIAFNPESQTEEVAIAAYVVCSLIILFAFLGIYAAVRESVCLAAVCAAFLLILAVLQITATCIGLNERAETNSGLAIVEHAWTKDAMHDLQQRYECCGKTSVQDYVLLNKPVPVSCYSALKPVEANLYLEGCVDKVQTYYEDERERFIVVSWLLIILELLCFFLAVYLVINFRNKQRRLQF